MTFRATLEAEAPTQRTCPQCHAHPKRIVRVDHRHHEVHNQSLYMCPRCAREMVAEIGRVLAELR